MQGRSTVQLPDATKDQVEALRIRLAQSIGKVPANHEVIGAVLVVGNARYDETLAALIQIRETE